MINNITSFPKHSHHPNKTKRANTTKKIKKKYQKIKKKSEGNLPPEPV
jgi:hypothetical protein